MTVMNSDNGDAAVVGGSTSHSSSLTFHHDDEARVQVISTTKKNNQDEGIQTFSKEIDSNNPCVRPLANPAADDEQEEGPTTEPVDYFLASSFNEYTESSSLFSKWMKKVEHSSTEGAGVSDGVLCAKAFDLCCGYSGLIAYA